MILFGVDVRTSECVFRFFIIRLFSSFDNGAISMKEHDGPGLLLSSDVNSALRMTLKEGCSHLEKALDSLSFHFLVQSLQYLLFLD
jgi:hypothetical protein